MAMGMSGKCSGGLPSSRTSGGVGVSSGVPLYSRTLGDPNPMKFKLIREQVFGNCLLAEIQYPDCNNYEGRKILAFKGVKTLRGVKEIDPHFLEKGRSPFLRLEPTEFGWRLGVYFLSQLSLDVRVS